MNPKDYGITDRFLLGLMHKAHESGTFEIPGALLLCKARGWTDYVGEHDDGPFEAPTTVYRWWLTPLGERELELYRRTLKS